MNVWGEGKAFLRGLRPLIPVSMAVGIQRAWRHLRRATSPHSGCTAAGSGYEQTDTFPFHEIFMSIYMSLFLSGK
jgi:hypothetical protein